MVNVMMCLISVMSPRLLLCDRSVLTIAYCGLFGALEDFVSLFL